MQRIKQEAVSASPTRWHHTPGLAKLSQIACEWLQRMACGESKTLETNSAVLSQHLRIVATAQPSQPSCAPRQRRIFWELQANQRISLQFDGAHLGSLFDHFRPVSFLFFLRINWSCRHPRHGWAGQLLPSTLAQRFFMFLRSVAELQVG